MKILLCQYDQIVGIKVARDDLTIDEVADDILRPLLLAAGFQPESVDRVITPEHEREKAEWYFKKSVAGFAPDDEEPCKGAVAEDW